MQHSFYSKWPIHTEMQSLSEDGTHKLQGLLLNAFGKGFH